MIDRRELKVDYFKVAGCNVTITHIPSGLVEYANETRVSIDTAVARLEARLKAREPYYGDPGDENDVSRWEGEGGH